MADKVVNWLQVADKFPVPLEWDSERTEQLYTRLDHQDLWVQVAENSPNTSPKTPVQCRVRLMNSFRYNHLLKQGLMDNFVDDSAGVWTLQDDNWLVQAVAKLVNWEGVADGFFVHEANEEQGFFTADQCRLEFVNVYLCYTFATKDRKGLFLFDSRSYDPDYCDWVESELREHRFLDLVILPAFDIGGSLVAENYKFVSGGSPGLKDFAVKEKYDFDLIVIDWGKEGKYEAVQELKRVVGRRRPYTVVVYDKKYGIPDGMGHDEGSCMKGVNACIPKDYKPKTIASVIEKMKKFNFAV